jgi:hypothetical protein
MDGPARTFARVALAVNDEMMYGERLKAWLAALQDEFPAWEVWYVLLYPAGVRWCARPQGCQDASRNVYADAAVRLTLAISEAAP